MQHKINIYDQGVFQARAASFPSMTQAHEVESYRSKELLNRHYLEVAREHVTENCQDLHAVLYNSIVRYY